MKKSKIETLLEQISKEDMNFIPSRTERLFLRELIAERKQDYDSFMGHLRQYQEIYKSKYTNNQDRK